MQRDVDVVLDDILGAIAVIEEAVGGRGAASFANSQFIQYGIERALEIISEAVRHLPDDLLAQRQEIDWPGIRAIGNLMRHEYWRVDPKIIATVVRDDLPPLRRAVEALMARRR